MTFCLVVRALFVVFVVVVAADEILLLWVFIFLSDELKPGFKISESNQITTIPIKTGVVGFFFQLHTCCSTSNCSNFIILKSNETLIIYMNMYMFRVKQPWSFLHYIISLCKKIFSKENIRSLSVSYLIFYN